MTVGAGDRWDCLLVTFYPLARLTTRKSGTLRRLAMLVNAVRKSGASLRVCCSFMPSDLETTLEEASHRLARDIEAAWGIRASVVATVSGPGSTAPWILQQVDATLGYARSPLVRSRVTDAAVALVRAELARRPGVVIAHRLPAMFALNAAGGPLPSTVFDLDDIEHVVLARSARQAASPRDKAFDWLRVPSVVLEELRSVRRAARTLVCSDRDAAYLRRRFRVDTIDAVPNALPIPPAPQPLVRNHRMLMVGAYDYGPNADAAEFFITRVLPLIRAEEPDAELRLVGAAPEVVPSFARKPSGVTFVGFADDLDAEYANARVVVCPIRYGGGTRVKLVEAAGWGKPIVSTTVGAEGLDFEHRVHALIADSAEGIAASCLSLLRDDALCTTLSHGARALAVDRYDAEHVSDRLGALLRDYLHAQTGPAAPVMPT